MLSGGGWRVKSSTVGIGSTVSVVVVIGYFFCCWFRDFCVVGVGFRFLLVFVSCNVLKDCFFFLKNL